MQILVQTRTVGDMDKTRWDVYEAKSWNFHDGVVQIWGEGGMIATYAREFVVLVKKLD